MRDRAARWPKNYPWMKFYTSDWRKNTKLRVCSLGARGLWLEMLCFMHEAEPPGSLLIGGQKITPKMLANLIATPLRITNSLLNELERNDIFSRDEDGTIFSRRMREDVEKQWANRKNGSLGGNPNLKGRDNQGVNPLVEGENKAQKSEDRGQKTYPLSQKSAPHTQNERENLFSRFAGAYPSDGLKLPDEARRALDARLDEGVSIDDIVAGANAYREFCRSKNRTGQFVKGARAWLEGGGWKDVQLPDKGAPPPDKTFVARDDPRWPALSDRYKAGHHSKLAPPGDKGWFFSNEWIASLDLPQALS